MEISRFSFEGRTYVVAFEVYKEFQVWTETLDEFHWGQVTKSTDLNVITINPTMLFRKIWQIVKSFIYQNNLPYFEIEVADRKRSQIYMRFLSELVGYRSHRHGNSYYVLKTKP